MSGDERMFHIIWPDNRRVPASKILGWYADARANGEIEDAPENATNALAAARVLDHYGLITLGRI